ncbi:hypothetical protein [Cohaesibacter haloalkalitolerans]|uniref:hypothetical protein n=1 Tax=Cohaesibacter haloalkalitolerans TaxID=1162980 RepID=UPI0013C49E6A|nr:hypothetical protein [Cohaesibacter haloalkalitolerans]
MSRFFRPVLAASVLLCMTSGAFADFDSDVAKAYAPYRVALFKSNQKDAEGAKQAIAKFQSIWNGTIIKTYTDVPARYAGEAKWSETLATIGSIADKAADATAKGDVLEAHDVLEAIRGELDDLRDRNGVMVFSSYVNAYHASMEPVLLTKVSVEGWSDAVRGDLFEKVGVLRYVADNLARHAPADLMANDEFKGQLKDLNASVEGLSSALKSNDPAAVVEAMKKLKPAYSKLFVKFG